MPAERARQRPVRAPPTHMPPDPRAAVGLCTLPPPGVWHGGVAPTGSSEDAPRLPPPLLVAVGVAPR